MQIHKEKWLARPTRRGKFLQLQGGEFGIVWAEAILMVILHWVLLAKRMDVMSLYFDTYIVYACKYKDIGNAMCLCLTRVISSDHSQRVNIL